jgi:hypothetical protein
MARVRRFLILIVISSGGCLAAEPCGPIEGVEALLGPGRILLLGELHGTEESPAFALDVACHASGAGLDVIVGLELTPAEQQRVDTFVDSTGTEQDREALLVGSVWRRDYQDGRNSRAMFELIDGVRRLRREKQRVSVALFDASGAGGGQQRERGMATHLAAAAHRLPEAMLIVLTGNHHSRVSYGTPRASTYEPMGYLLGKKTSADRLTSLNVAHGGGSAWICSSTCGIVELGGGHGGRRWAVEVDDETRPAGHHGWYHVGALTASPPTNGSGDDAVIPRHPTAVRKEAETPRDPVATGPLTEIEQSVQGEWQAYDFGSNSRTWRIRFAERRFHASAGADDWYAGHIAFRPDADPAEIDFAIEDCVCSYKGMTSRGIYRRDGSSIVISAPTPGTGRPTRFVERSGSMMRLLRLEGE